MATGILNKLPIIGAVLAIRDAVYLLWSWIARNIKLVKVPFFFTFTAASIRAAVHLAGVLYTRLTTVQSTAVSVANGFVDIGTPQGTLLDKINAVLPVGETLAFLAAYVSVLLLTTAYMFIRSAYNAVPGKFS